MFNSHGLKTWEFLQTVYMANAELSICIRKLPALAFMQPNEVEQSFDDLKHSSSVWVVICINPAPCFWTFKVAQQDCSAFQNINVPQGLDQIFIYFEKYYVKGILRRNGSRGAVKFPIEKWNVHDSINEVVH